MKRVDMYYFSNLVLFKALLSNRADWYLRARHSLREMKKIFK